MRWTFAVVGLALALSATSAQDDKKGGKVDKAKLVGTWSFVKTDAKEAPPPGSDVKVTFSKDGKIDLSLKIGDKAVKFGGTYTLKGDVLTTKIKYPDDTEKTEDQTITVLTDKKLVMTEKKDGKAETTEFKK